MVPPGKSAVSTLSKPSPGPVALAFVNAAGRYSGVFETASCASYLARLGSGERHTGPGREALEYLKIVLLCTVSAVVYGILHDTVTAHVSLEYFSTGFHDANLQAACAPLNGFLRRAQSPFFYALVWGVIATWWVGVPLGFVLGLGARAGGGVSPRFSWRRMLPRVAVILVFTFLCAAVSGVLRYVRPDTAAAGDTARRYLTALSVHNTSYIVSVPAGLAAAAWTAAERRFASGKLRRERRECVRLLLDLYAAHPGDADLRTLLEEALS